jgi:hypothetical protein
MVNGKAEIDKEGLEQPPGRRRKPSAAFKGLKAVMQGEDLTVLLQLCE